ncbi:MAG: hypothetical protein QG608_1922 [Actinomycetota bacterium]|nr:hypothetical protein [Actinomycetota bacterium]
MRPFQAFRFTTGLVLLPFLLVVVRLFSGVLENVSPEYDQSVSGKASSAVIPVAPMLAAACAWTGWRVHRTRRQFMNSVRSGFVVAVDGLWPLLFVGAGAVLFSYGLEFFYSGLPFHPDPGILAVSLLLVFAVYCASYSLGTKLTPLISAPLALSLTYAWLVVPSTLDTLWVRHMNGVLDDCCLERPARGGFGSRRPGGVRQRCRRPTPKPGRRPPAALPDTPRTAAP